MNFQEAQRLLAALKERERILLAILDAVLELHGAGSRLDAMVSMKDVAFRVGLPVKTVVRAVEGKTVRTPEGIVPMRSLFASGGQRGARSEAVMSMATRVVLVLVLAAVLAFADDLRLSATCDDQGNLILHGEGAFGAGETVDIRLFRCVDSSREYKAGKQVQSGSGVFDATLEPGDLPIGDYVVEVRVAGLAAGVGVHLSSLRAVEKAREEEQRVLLGFWRRIRAESRELDATLAIVDRETRESRLETWEKGALSLASEIERRDSSQLAEARQALREAVELLVVLSRVHRCVADAEMGDLLKKHMVMNEDGAPKRASEVLETGRRAFAGSLADSFCGVMRKSLEEIDRALARVEGKKKKEAERFRSTVGAWAAGVSKSCDRERKNIIPDGPYADAVGEEIGRLRSCLRELADASCLCLDRDAEPDAFRRISTLRTRIDTCLTRISELARQ